MSASGSARSAAVWPMLRAAVLAATAVLAGCAQLDAKDTPRPLLPSIDAVLSAPGGAGATSRAAASLERELLPPPQVAMPELPSRPPEPRFDLNVVDASLQQVLPALVSGTRYSMIVHPDVKGNITLRLKDTTVPEALDLIRDMYGWDWRQDGTRIQVAPASMQTRIFKVNYPSSNRSGRSETRVMSGSIQPGGGGGVTPAAPGASGVPGAAQPAGGSAGAMESTRITTQHRADIWVEVESTLKSLVGERDGRQVIVSPQTGVIVIRAMTRELRIAEAYLREMRMNVERQVMLEAKIVEVSLKDSYQSGVNWAAFRPGGDTRLSAGILSPGTTLGPSPAGSISTNNGLTAAPPGGALSLAATATSGLFGLAFQTGNFAAMISFLETQGAVQVLSSPRIATLNNQKAVLKVGSDDFYVTNVSTTTVTSGTGNTTSPTITTQPFFSGIALDVTPQIDEDSNIILHVHPQVSQVEEKQKQLNLGSLGNFTLPLASSSVRETDAIVRVPDGNIVAIGGLMRQDTNSSRTQLPVAGDMPSIGRLFGQRGVSSSKQELVILIKPTVIQSRSDWEESREQSATRIRDIIRP
jgi:MSHA biogenesis protein MshL